MRKAAFGRFRPEAVVLNCDMVAGHRETYNANGFSGSMGILDQVLYDP